MGDWQVNPFYRFGPRIAASRDGNLGRFSEKFHDGWNQNALFIRVHGVWGAE